MPQTVIEVTDIVDPAATMVVGQGLNRHNDEAAGYADRMDLAVLVRSDTPGREILGGALGRTSLGLLFLELFYLPKTLRGSGLGTDILARFEAEGRRRGCRAAVLYTISFQAPGFYERNGWHRFGEVPCDPPAPAASS